MNTMAVGTEVIGPLINLGAVGVCLVALAAYYIKKDAKHEALHEQRIVQEKSFRQEITDLHEKHQVESKESAEKYRLALEKFGQTMDAVIRMKRGRGDS